MWSQSFEVRQSQMFETNVGIVVRHQPPPLPKKIKGKKPLRPIEKYFSKPCLQDLTRSPWVGMCLCVRENVVLLRCFLGHQPSSVWSGIPTVFRVRLSETSVFSHLLRRTSCLFHWHVCFPVGTATHDSKRGARLCFAAEGAAAVQLREAAADPRRHLGARPHASVSQAHQGVRSHLKLPGDQR